jgi:hypothetical protein
MAIHIPSGQTESTYYLAQGWIGGAWLEVTERFPAATRYETARAAQDGVQFWIIAQVRGGYDSNPRGRVVEVKARVVSHEEATAATHRLG